MFSRMILEIGHLRSDLRVSVRSLLRTPTVTVVIVLILAAGIGANAAIYGMLAPLFILEPPHIEQPKRVHRVYVRQASFLGNEVVTNDKLDWSEFTALRAAKGLFADIAGYTYPRRIQQGLGRTSEEVRVSWVTGRYSEFLGAIPAAGRRILPGDDDLAAVPVAAIGHGYWARRFGRGSSALGSTLEFDGLKYTIVGVMPAGFSGPDRTPVDVWLPLTHAATASRGESWRRSLTGFSLTALVRLRALVTRAGAGAAATGILRGVRAGSEVQDTEASVLLGPILKNRGPGRKDGYVLLSLVVGGVAGVILLIATANVANLLTLRVAGRSREFGIRTALGAGNWGLTRLLTVESAVLALVSAVAALGVTMAVRPVLEATLLAGSSQSGNSLGVEVLVFTVLMVVTVALCVSVVPIMQALRLPAPNGRAHRTRTRGRAALIVVQGALSVVLLVGACLFYRSFEAARSLDVGYAKENLLTVTLDRPRSQRTVPLDDALVESMMARLRLVPGVRSVAQGTNTPLGRATTVKLRADGLAELPRMNGPFANLVTRNYFSVAGLEMLAGRGFLESDVTGSQRVVVVNSRLARLTWPGREAIGRCVFVGNSPAGCSTVIGVVETPLEFGLREADGIPQFYLPIVQASSNEDTSRLASARRTLVISTDRDPASVTGSVTAVLTELFSDLPGGRVRSLPAVFAPRVRSWRIGSVLFGSAAALAVLLAAIGFYALISFSVRERQFELGVRRALGARRSDLVRSVLAQGCGFALTGVVVGVAVALYSGRFVEPLLFMGRSSLDLAAFVAGAGVLLVVATLASVLPAAHAANADPCRALRPD